MHFLFLFSLAAIAFSASIVTAGPTGLDTMDLTRRDMYSLATLEMEKRGCSKPCPNGQRKEGCLCVDNPPVVAECPLLCVSKPFVAPSPFGPGQKQQDCPQSKLPIAGGPVFITPDPEHKTKHWDMANSGGKLFRNRRGDERFDGSLNEAGELNMGSKGVITVGFKYVVALKVGEWVSYYDLKGFTNCKTPAPKVKNDYLLLEKVTVYDNGF